MKYWLFKTEPDVFSIHDLAKSPAKTACWEGVRNYQARNMLRDETKVGDRVLIYHSGGTSPCIAGVASIAKAGYPDSHSWDRKSKYYDSASSPENPRWYMVDVRLDQIFPCPLTLAGLREVKGLAEMGLLRKGNRLSIQPVTKGEFAIIVKLAVK